VPQLVPEPVLRPVRVLRQAQAPRSVRAPWRRADWLAAALQRRKYMQ
jgi:hypothetical protein